jgi:hypothetical protein
MGRENIPLATAGDFRLCLAEIKKGADPVMCANVLERPASSHTHTHTPAVATGTVLHRHLNTRTTHTLVCADMGELQMKMG